MGQSTPQSRLHLGRVKLAPAGCHVLVGPDQIHRAGLAVVALLQDALCVDQVFAHFEHTRANLANADVLRRAEAEQVKALA